jgi:hypothetical protein
MEPADAWEAWGIQLANWIMVPTAWEEPEATEIFGNEDPIDKAAQELDDGFQNMETKIDNNPIHAFEEEAREFKVDIDMMKMKIHKYPPSIRPLGEGQWFITVPKLVAMGPYHHGQHQLKQAEKAKHVAAYHCIMESAHSVQEMYDAVASAAYHARSLYDKDVMAGIGDGDFLPMMFYDACFLVQYMVSRTEGSDNMDPSLRAFLDFNRKAIRQDIMLLENQIPWQVVEAVMRFRPVNLAEFVALWKDYLQDRKDLEEKNFVWDESYEPPHLLSLLRFYIVGRTNNAKLPTKSKISSISVSVSAIELAQIGMKLTANQATELVHMGINKRGILLAELSLTPLSLDDERASFLINMAALELCTTSSFQDAEEEDSAVCSYLLLLSMLVHREEDVQELRTKHLLQGGAGLVNKDALDFFTSLQSLPLRGSSCFVRIMVEIENYRVNRRLKIKLHAFFYRNKKTIVTVFSIFGVLVSILGTLLSLKGRIVL